MKEQFKDFFYFSRGEKNGIIVLLSILVLVIVTPYLSKLFSNDKPHINQQFNKEIELFTQSLKINEEPEYNNRLNQYIIERYDSLKLFFFNPNTTSPENFKKLGLTDKQISTINNYLSKGGKFYVKDDFRKIYGIRHQQYQILRPYILLPDKEQITSSEFNYKQNQSGNSDSLFVFDPNTTTHDDFIKLGLSEKQSNTIKNYLDKGGSFKSKEDLKKVYGIDESVYEKLEPYIFIRPSKEAEKEQIVEKIELNQATSEQLSGIKGIGEYSAQAIVNYRNKIGGFVKLEQLLEIKSIDKQYFEYFKNNLSVDASKIKKLSLNFSEVEDLVAHPYLNYRQAKEIVKFRSENGPYTSTKQLLENKILLEQSYKKMEPYLKLN